jgi:hypothetical protein
VTPDSGHSVSEKGNTAALVGIMEELKGKAVGV